MSLASKVSAVNNVFSQNLKKWFALGCFSWSRRSSALVKKQNVIKNTALAFQMESNAIRSAAVRIV